VEFDVILGKGRNEIVGVIIALLHTQVKWVASFAASFFEIFWKKLLSWEEIVIGTLVDQDWDLRTIIGSHKYSGVISFTCLGRTKVSFKSFNTPWTGSWVADRGES